MMGVDMDIDVDHHLDLSYISSKFQLRKITIIMVGIVYCKDNDKKSMITKA